MKYTDLKRDSSAVLVSLADALAHRVAHGRQDLTKIDKLLIVEVLRRES
jgi:hypothetical protein